MSKSGEQLGLYYAQGGDTLEVDVIDIPALTNDQSYGRETDGAANWMKFDIATPNDTNRVIEEEVEDTTGIEQQLLSEIQVYPNPATDVLTIDLGAVTQTIQIQFIDAVGRVVKTESISGDQNQLDISDLNQGMYFISLSSADGVQRIEKLVKE